MSQPRLLRAVKTVVWSQTRRYYASNASSNQSPPAQGPLSGITVVSLEQAIAAPFATRQLADLGARVIKVERPGAGDFARQYDNRVNGMASHFIWTNRSKESLALDLKKAEDLNVLKTLVQRADVLVQNLAPGATGRMGMAYEDLKDKYPELIVCDISGYGQDGPYRDKKAYDLLIQSEAGMLSVNGVPRKTGPGKDDTIIDPAKVGVSIADIAAGMYSYSSILAALMQRQKTGQGCKIDISMLEAMTEWMSFPLYYTFDGAPGPTPAGSSHASIYPYGRFQASDGAVMLGIQNEREWANFCKIVLGNEKFTNDPRFENNTLRSQNRADLQGIIEESFSKRTANEVVALLEKASIANANVNDMHGVWKHPQLQARERWTTVDTPRGKVPALFPPGFEPLSRSGLHANMGKVPAVGEHNSKILAELGLRSS